MKINVDHTEYRPIGILRTCFAEKFGAPRQSLMVKEARGILKLNPDPGFRDALQHLDEFSHVWIIFEFHQSIEKGWRPTIEPPRVSAPGRIGVFASRSPHRPNPIGLSAVKLDRIDRDAPGGIEIHLSGVDILDETPVLDIKPYLPFADRIAEANDGWAEGEIKKYPVSFSQESEATLSAESSRHPRLRELILQILEWDPRPTPQRKSMPFENPETTGKIFGLRILEFEVKWRAEIQSITVLSVTRLPATL